MKSRLTIIDSHRFTLLLLGAIASMVLVVFQTQHSLIWLQGLVNAILLASIFGTLRESPLGRNVGVIFLILATVLLEVNHQTGWRSSILVILQVLLNTLLYLLLAVTTLRFVLRHPVITLELVNGALAAYTLLVLIYGRLYGVTEHLVPGSFRFVTPPATQLGIPPYPDLIYFSMTALTTVGFGDIVPVSSLARALTMTETLLGQLYLTVLVARLVGIHIANMPRPQEEKLPED